MDGTGKLGGGWRGEAAGGKGGISSFLPYKLPRKGQTCFKARFPALSHHPFPNRGKTRTDKRPTRSNRCKHKRHPQAPRTGASQNSPSQTARHQQGGGSSPLQHTARHLSGTASAIHPGNLCFQGPWQLILQLTACFWTRQTPSLGRYLNNNVGVPPHPSFPYRSRVAR